MDSVITVAVEVEPVVSVKQVESASSSCSLSDYGGSNSELSFVYPGDMLSDDEFNEEFSSSFSSRRSSTDTRSISPLLLLAASFCEADSSPTCIPIPPPPPPLPSDASHAGLQISPASPSCIPPPPPPPPLPSWMQDSPLLSSPFSIFPFPPSPPPSPLLQMDDVYTPSRPLPRRSRMVSYMRSSAPSSPSSSLPRPRLSSKCEDNARRQECTVCYDSVAPRKITTRRCCSQVICKACVKEIIRTNVEDEGNVHILCPNPDCKDGVITRDEVMANASSTTKERYDRLRLRESEDGGSKTCPNCYLMTKHKLPGRFKRFKPENVWITCEKCSFVWCFHCQSPWHQNVTCRQYRKGEKDFKKWTRSKTAGNANCQKCPLCRVYIQRSNGCDHMTCNRCEAEFCYKCGGVYMDMPFLGHHHDATSVLGCTYNYKPHSPVQRKAVRGGYLAAKLAMLTGYPVLFVAGVGVVLLVGAVALPIYAGYRFYKFRKNTEQIRTQKRPHRQQFIPDNISYISDISN